MTWCPPYQSTTIDAAKPRKPMSGNRVDDSRARSRTLASVMRSFVRKRSDSYSSRVNAADLGDGLLQHPHGLALGVLRLAGDRADAAPEELADESDRRRDHEREQGEPPVHQEDHNDAADQGEDLAEDGDDRLGDHAVDERRVARDVRHELAGLASGEERERQRLQVPHDLHPEIEDHLLAGPGHDVATQAVDGGPDEQDGDEPEHQLVEERRILQAEVEHPEHDLRPDESEDR
jgi:hypothetical protein